MVDLDAAYASCARDARGHYENFPVASLLIPRHMRRHVAAIYAFARAADDFADEGSRSAAERHRLLDGWRCRLLQTRERDLVPPPAALGEPANTVEIFVALAATIRDAELPLPLFEDLLSAFRQDVSVTRYATWDELLDYCRRSANPIGRLVLRVAGYRSDRLDTWSDAVCTALQLTNFWQDFAIDLSRGRIYVPQEVLHAHGAREQDLAGAGLNQEWRASLAAVVARTRALFVAGRPVADAVRGRLRFELRATWLGGMRVLGRLEQSRFDPLHQRPRLHVADLPWFTWRMLRWPS